MDANGVDLGTGAFNFSAVEVTIGQPGAGGLAYVRSFVGPGWRDNYVGTINSSGTTYTVSTGASSETFTLTNGVYTSDQAVGSTLILAAGLYTYTAAGGIVAVFDTALANGGAVFDANVARITSLTLPNGEAITFHYKSVTVQSVPALRLQSVTNNLGYQLHFEYSLNNPTLSSQLTAWKTLTKVTGINNAVDYCNPTADTCSLSGWPTVTYSVSGSYETATDALARATRYGFGATGLTSIRRPSSTSNDHITINYGAGRVTSVVHGTNSWTYSYSDNASQRTTTVTDPNSNTRVVISDINTLQVLSDRDGANRTVSYIHDSNERVTRITQPEGNYTAFSYDGRGNVTEVRQVAKSGSGLSDIVVTADYPDSCTDPGVTIVTCNLPISTTDARGFRTDFTYHTTHGGILTATSPAPSGSAPVGSGVRPQTRYSYSQLFAWYKQSSGGSPAQAPSAVYRLTQISSCATSSWTGSACSAGAADETRTTIDFGSGGGANNRLPVQVTTASGSGSLSATATNTYDPGGVGNLETVDGPLTGDAIRYRYDAARQLIGVIGPDPDGGGSLKHRATRITYNADGQPTVVEQGTVDSQSDAHWTAFASLLQQTTAYDFVGRPIQRSLTANSATHAVVQMSYDAASRLDCIAQRMNPAVFGSLPSSACSLGTAGAQGPDRIARYNYNGANQTTQVTIGHGMTGYSLGPINEWTATYGANGQMATLTDAGGNVTAQTYDGFDRPSKICFAAASCSGATDYEQLSYDIVNNRITLQRRGSSPPTIAYTYDNLGRFALSDATNGPDTSYTYDNFGRMLTAADSARTLTYGYDQLSRLTSEQQGSVGQQGALGTVSYEYDAAGRRTRITWPGSFCAQYDYDLANALTQIRAEGGSCTTTTLATYAYDNLGRRTSVTRGNSVSSTFAYDTAQRLDQIAHNLDGTGSDQTLTFDYNAAGQIVSRAGTDADYAWTPLAPATTAYADNALNQYTSVGGAAQAYDGRGNLTTGSFQYDDRNRLTNGPSSATLAYDPAGGLYKTVGAATTHFLYDGAQIIAEYDGSATPVLQRRFVPGPGLDEPIVWYEGSGTSDRRWFVADERGSVIAITNGSGAMTNINRYDEYGIPHASNVGRFQYTGQAWLPDVARYHYRARVYAPNTGRFQQTDPVLHAGGMNLYAYVGNDPVNFTDPLGLQAVDDPACNSANPPPRCTIIVTGQRRRRPRRPYTIWDAGRPAWEASFWVSDYLSNWQGQNDPAEMLSSLVDPARINEDWWWMDLTAGEEVNGQQPAQPGFTPIQCVNCSVPRNPACTANSYSCLENARSAEAAAHCRWSWMRCEMNVAETEANRRLGIIQVWPDWSVMEIYNGGAFVAQPGRPVDTNTMYHDPRFPEHYGGN